MAAGTTTYRPVASGLDTDGVLTALAQAGFTTEPPRQSTLAVLDTFDGRIADADLRLELVDGRQLVLRGEGEVPAAVTVATQPRVAADVPAGPLRQRLARLLDVRALLRLVEVTSQRTEATKRNRAGKVTAAVTVHRDTLANGGSFGPAVLVEATELTGYQKPAEELHRLLDRARARADRGRPRRPRRDAAPGSRSVATRYPSVCRSTPEMSAIDGFRAVLANLRDAMLANWTGTIADIDSEFLHDLRVAVRRSRVVLANAARVLPEECAERTREDFAWFGEITGNPRDLDVYQLEWPDYTADLDAGATKALVPLREHLGVAARGGARRAEGPADVGAGGRGDRSLERMARRPGRSGHARRPRRRGIGGHRAPSHPPRPSSA